MQKINVIIPMAGEGRRFKEAGFKKPKPLIKVFNKTLIEIAIETLDIKNANNSSLIDSNYSHYIYYYLVHMEYGLSPFQK